MRAQRRPALGSESLETTYLVKCFWPGVTREAVETASERARQQAAAQLRSTPRAAALPVAHESERQGKRASNDGRVPNRGSDGD